MCECVIRYTWSGSSQPEKAPPAPRAAQVHPPPPPPITPRSPFAAASQLACGPILSSWGSISFHLDRWEQPSVFPDGPEVLSF